MKLTSKEARNILENARKHTEEDRWIDHCIYVGNTGAKIAEALNEKGHNVDAEKTRTLGYVHDIGKMIALPYGHEINGFNYMKEQGYDEEYYNICITHSYLNNDINCVAGGVKNPDEDPFITILLTFSPFSSINPMKNNTITNINIIIKSILVKPKFNILSEDT